MLTRLFATFLISVLSLSNASFAETSFICPQTGLRYKNITCCEDFVSFEKCKSVADGQIPGSTLASLRVFNKLYTQGYFFAGTTPNCHWLSRYFHQPVVQSFYQVDPLELHSYLQRHFSAVPPLSELQVGDIIYFSFEATDAAVIKTSSASSLVNSGFYDHSGVYMGDGLIFQKENAFSDVFTLTNLEHARSRYEAETLKTSGLNGKFHWQAWRSRAQ